MLQVVIPTERDLQIEDNGFACTVEGCERFFQTSSQLHMHVTKHHQGEKLSHKTGSRVYYCPIINCKRGVATGEPFTRLGQLKQHYQRIHGNKSHICKLCGKEFSLKDVYQRHFSDCGKEFRCKTCGDVFTTRNALYKHARRKGHVLPVGSKPRKKKPPAANVGSGTTGVGTGTANVGTGTAEVGTGTAKVGTGTTGVGTGTAMTLVIQPLVIKQPISRGSKLVSASTQTEEEELIIQPSSNPGTGEELLPSYHHESGIHTSFLDLSTQTDSFEPHFNFSTQTDLTEFFNFGTQTIGHHHDMGTQSSQTQTPSLTQPPSQHHSYSQTPVLSPPAPLLSPPQGPPVQVYFQRDINYSALDYVDLGSQTASHQMDFGSQTISHQIEFGSQTIPHHMEFGSQATPHHMEFGSQTTSDSAASQCLLNDSRTYLMKETICMAPSSEYSDGLECVEFGTQTPSPLTHYYPIATQTSPPPPEDFYSHLESPRTDFGTQTIDDLFSDVIIGPLYCHDDDTTET